ncbi:L,D-transpeptidase [Aquisalimonas sp.]|uniref:L,D-transpeptidase family protein n=1 Tax=Aquisalimonas sp. TaxID=1872621 RepID=UPI0025BD2781|nr:L,D-transpeptidase [Aquisalimonas sp.]
MTRLLALLLGLFACATLSAGDTLVLVDTDRQELRVIKGGDEVLHIPRIAIGRGGTSHLRERGDRTTPLGDFRVAWVNYNSRFHMFFGLDFPNLQHARLAYNEGVMELDELLDVTDALRARELPPQRTAVGGHIGIHGLGRANPNIHSRTNWTRGCIAVTNQEVEALAEYVSIGTRVIVTADEDIIAQARR